MVLRLFKISFILVFVISLNACSETQKVFCFSEYYGEVEIKNDNEAFKGQLSFKAKEDIEFTLKQPRNIENATYRYSGGKKTLEQDGIVIDISDVILNSPVLLMFDALSVLLTPFNINKTGNQTLSFSNDNGDITIEINCDENKIISIEQCGYSFIFC